MMELHNPKPLGVPYRNTLSHWFTGNTCSTLLVLFRPFNGFSTHQPTSKLRLSDYRSSRDFR